MTEIKILKDHHELLITKFNDLHDKLNGFISSFKEDICNSVNEFNNSIHKKLKTIEHNFNKIQEENNLLKNEISKNKFEEKNFNDVSMLRNLSKQISEKDIKIKELENRLKHNDKDKHNDKHNDKDAKIMELEKHITELKQQMQNLNTSTTSQNDIINNTIPDRNIILDNYAISDTISNTITDTTLHKDIINYVTPDTNTITTTTTTTDTIQHKDTKTDITHSEISVEKIKKIRNPRINKKITNTETEEQFNIPKIENGENKTSIKKIVKKSSNANIISNSNDVGDEKLKLEIKPDELELAVQNMQQQSPDTNTNIDNSKCNTVEIQKNKKDTGKAKITTVKTKASTSAKKDKSCEAIIPTIDKVIPTSEKVIPTSEKVIPTSEKVIPTSEKVISNIEEEKSSNIIVKYPDVIPDYSQIDLIEIDDVGYYKDIRNNNIYQITQDESIGMFIGIYDTLTKKIILMQ